LKEQANLKIKPEKERILQLVDSLETTDETAVVNVCDTLAHSVFIPWLNKQNQANKVYFAKKGGIVSCVKWMKEATTVETQAYAGTAVWNFSESGVMHEILWRNGAVDALLGFLKSPSTRLQRVAVGALFGLLDYDSNTGAYLALNYDRELVEKLIETKQDNPTWSFKLAKIGCLLSLAKHPSTRQEIFERDGLKIFREDKQDSLINFLNSLGLAHLLAGDVEIDPEERSSSLQVIAKQLEMTPREIREKESLHGLVWTSVKHHLRLMRDKEVLVRHIALFSLANLSYSDYNRSLMIEEDLVDDIACMKWMDDGEFEERKQSYLGIIGKNFPGGLPVPSLYHICVDHIHRKSPHLAEYII